MCFSCLWLRVLQHKKKRFYLCLSWRKKSCRFSHDFCLMIFCGTKLFGKSQWVQLTSSIFPFCFVLFPSFSSRQSRRPFFGTGMDFGLERERERARARDHFSLPHPGKQTHPRTHPGNKVSPTWEKKIGRKTTNPSPNLQKNLCLLNDEFFCTACIGNADVSEALSLSHIFPLSYIVGSTFCDGITREAHQEEEREEGGKKALFCT